MPLSKARESLERELLSRSLTDTRFNISKTARKLGISRPTVYRLIRKYGLEER
jgi:transcriptional regulator of acetoin/glycerol metabolism